MRRHETLRRAGQRFSVSRHGNRSDDDDDDVTAAQSFVSVGYISVSASLSSNLCAIM